MNIASVFRGPATIDPPHLVQVTPPKGQVFTSQSALVRQMLRRDEDAPDDEYVDMCMLAAQTYFEQVTGVALLSQQWRLEYDMTPIRQGQFGLEYGLAPTMSRFTGAAAGREILFAKTPLISIDSFEYVAQDNTVQTFAATNYTAGNVGVDTAPGRLWLNEDSAWPDYASVPAALRITFTVGYGTSAASIAPTARMAVLQLGGHWYENRLPMGSSLLGSLPIHLEALIQRHKLSFVS